MIIVNKKEDDLWLPPDDPCKIVGGLFVWLLLPFIMLPILAPVGVPLFAILSLFDVENSPYVFIPGLFVSGVVGWLLWKKAFQKYPFITTGIAIVIFIIEMVYMYNHLYLEMMQAR